MNRLLRAALALALALPLMGGLDCDDDEPEPVSGTTGVTGLPIGPVGQPGVISIFGPTNDPTGTGIQGYVFAWGDGSPTISSIPGFPAQHAYVAGGTYTITVTVFYGNNTREVVTAQVVVDLTPPTVTINRMTIKGTTSEPSTVTVNGLADDDGAQDKNWEKGFVLNGGALPNSLPPDPGAGNSQTYNFDVEATDQSGLAAPTQSLSVTINP